MKNRYFSLIAFGIISLVFASFFLIVNAKSETNDTTETNDKSLVILGFDPNVPPMGFTDQNGNYVGFDLDLAKEVFKTQNIDVKFQPIDWDSKEMELNTGKIDLIWNGLSYTTERSQNMLLTNSYMKNRQVVIVKKESNISKLDDLSEKNVCVQKGSTGAESFRESKISKECKQIVDLEDMVSCLNEVNIGTSDATIVDESVARYYLNQNSLQDKFRILDDEISTEDYVIAVKKGNEDLKNKIEYGFSQIIESGKAKEISERWFGEDIICFDKTAEKKNYNKENLNTWNYLSKGLLQTLKLFFVCLIFSIPLGLILCLLRFFNPLKILVDLYTWIMRGTPLLLQIFFIFYGIPIIFGLNFNNRFLIGAIAFILNYAAYFAEIFRGGLKSINRGQWEAIQILQISKIKAINKIVIPQILRVSLPSLCNECVTLVKDTSLVFCIGITELLISTKNIVNSSANVTTYALTAGIYLAICSVINVMFKIWESKVKY